MKWLDRELRRFRPASFGHSFAVAAALLILTFAATGAKGQGFQSWNEVDLTGSWRRVDFLVPLLARTGSSVPNPQLAATGVTADFGLPWHLTITGGYLFATLPQSSLNVHVPLVAATISFRHGRFAVAERNRFEKLVGFGAAPVRYRNRLLVDRPLGTADDWHVFADDEVFFDLSARNWNQNRFQVGAGRQLTRALFLDVYYLQKNPGHSALTTRALGTTLKISLKSRKENGRVQMTE